MTSPHTTPAAARDDDRGGHDERDERDGRDEQSGHERPLTGEERRTVAVLGLPTLTLALAITIVTTYLPVIAQSFVGSTLVIGLIVGLEGLIALWLPLVAGTWSDRLRSRFGGRLPFLIGATPVLVVALIAMSLVNSVGFLAAAALVFFVGYFLAYEPYRALYPDAVGDEIAGRAQGTQALFRGAGTGIALVSGGLLLGLGAGAPFLAAAGAALAGMSLFVVALLRRGVPDQERNDDGRGLHDAARQVWALIRDRPALRAFLLANGLWELSLGALKTFVFLYVTNGLGYSRVTATLAIGGVAVVVLLGALASGKVADRYGHMRVLEVAVPVYGAGFLIPLISATPWVVALSIPIIALGGGTLMALPYAVLMRLMPEGEHGKLTGFYSSSRGLGTWLGPLLAGVAITGLSGVLTATHGYQAMWGVCAAGILISQVPLRALRRSLRDSGRDER